VLLLFDIDGTLLLKASRPHLEALFAAISEVFGIPDPAAANVAPAGRTDGEIGREILLLSGASAQHFEENAAELRAVCCREFARRCPPDLKDSVAPGIRELLEALAARPGEFRLSLVTGNLEPIARVKLARAGIGHYFEPGQGGFGSDHLDRDALPAIARRRAGLDGHPHPRGETIVIGDTPADVACARADQLVCLALATGPYSADELRDADAVAADAFELARLLEPRLAAN
jgi:phosphoglycolate phosphatase-like HAD superfamily hydrolase